MTKNLVVVSCPTKRHTTFQRFSMHHMPLVAARACRNKQLLCISAPVHAQAMSKGLGLFNPAPALLPAAIASKRAGKPVWAPCPLQATFRRSILRAETSLASVSLVLCDDKPHSFGAPDILQVSWLFVLGMVLHVSHRVPSYLVTCWTYHQHSVVARMYIAHGRSLLIDSHHGCHVCTMEEEPCACAACRSQPVVSACCTARMLASLRSSLSMQVT